MFDKIRRLFSKEEEETQAQAFEPAGEPEAPETRYTPEYEEFVHGLNTEEEEPDPFADLAAMEEDSEEIPEIPVVKQTPAEEEEPDPFADLAAMEGDPEEEKHE